MAREILFKAKRKDNGEWVEGYLVKCRTSEEEVYAIKDTVYHVNDGIINLIPCVVDESTICQYTGLDDINGNKIWENDVVKYHFGDDVAQIKFGKYQSCFDSQKTCHVGFFVDWQKGYMRKDLGYWVEMIDCNIIGNIFDMGKEDFENGC